MAMHHLDLAEQSDWDNYLIHKSPLLEEIGESKLREYKSPFERVSPDLFLKLFSLCDAPSLVRSIGVSKAWKSPILGSSDLFRSFEMEGTGEQLCERLELFNRRNKDSTKHAILKVEDELDPDLQERLVNAIKQGSASIKTISIAHQGDLAKSLVKVAGQCHSLSVLRSTIWAHEGSLMSLMSLEKPSNSCLPEEPLSKFWTGQQERRISSATRPCLKSDNQQ